MADPRPLHPAAYLDLARMLGELERTDLTEAEEHSLAALVAAVGVVARRRGGIIGSAAMRPLAHLAAFAATDDVDPVLKEDDDGRSV